MIILMTLACQNQPPNQQDEDRVAVALRDKEALLKNNLAGKGINSDDLQVLFVAYKDLDRLEVYAKQTKSKTFTHIEDYQICKRSGVLGPKKAEGDKQVPEGFYYIDRFNAKSLYHLSLGLNYPNELDQNLGYTGSDIFIHGKCETIGCMPMTDDLIKEIYLYALWAKQAGQEQIPVYIFPFQMTDENIAKYDTEVDESTVVFWRNLQQGYTMFQERPRELRYHVQEGKYVFDK